MMRRIALVFACLALCAAAGVIGHRLGRNAVPDHADAVAARIAATRTAYNTQLPITMDAAYKRARDRAINTGLEQGQRIGRARGESAGTTAVQHQIDTFTQTQSATGGGESERAATQADAPVTGNVLVVGDSLEVLTSPYLKQFLPKVHFTINAVGGYSSIQIFKLFQESYDPSQSVIVFDAGTNDNPAYPQILASRLSAVANIVGDRCMVVPTIHGLVVNGLNSANKNKVVAQFAASRPGTQVPDWASFEAAHPELMQADDLHPIAAGAQQRARLIDEGVKACLQLQSDFPLGNG